MGTAHDEAVRSDESFSWVGGTCESAKAALDDCNAESTRLWIDHPCACDGQGCRAHPMPGLSRGCTAEANVICSVAGREILLCLACARYRVDRDLWTSIHAGEGEWFWIAGLQQFAARQIRAEVSEVVRQELARTTFGWVKMILSALAGYLLGKALF